jgi:hypothetical protein
MTFRTFLVVLLNLWSASLYAGGSVYSRFGIGDLTLFGSSRLYAMGNTGLSLYGDGFINRLNPAGLAGISETRISGSFEYQNFTSKDNLGTGTFARGDFQGLAFAIPIDREHGATLLFETTPYSTVRYAIERTDNQLGAISHQRFFGSGGLTTLGLGGSYAVGNRFFVGAKMNYLFGGIRQLSTINFEDDSYTDSELQRARYHSGFTFTLGAIVHGFGQLSPSLQPLSLGLVLSTPARLKVREELFHSIGSNPDTIRIGSSSLTIPLAWGIGLSYLFSERYIVAGDLNIQHWSSENFPEPQSVTIRESLRLSMGFEALPERNATAYLSRIAYRAGISYHSTYIKVGTQSIDELIVAGGLGLPIGPNSRLNLGLQVGTRGTTNVQRDTIVRLSLTLSGSEAWFIRFEED